MSYILSIDTSDTACSVAIHKEGKLISSLMKKEGRSSAEMLTMLIEEVMSKAQLTYSELSAVAISKGPGSYTGLRIGVSTAKGICYAAGLPLLSVNTLALMAEMLDTKSLLCPMIDARRMEVYCAVFDAYKKEVQPTAAIIIEEQSFSDLLEDHQITFYGSGAAKTQALLKSENAIFEMDIYPDAQYMGSIAFEKYKEGDFEDLILFEPYYLKEFMGTVPTKNKKVSA